MTYQFLLCTMTWVAAACTAAPGEGVEPRAPKPALQQLTEPGKVDVATRAGGSDLNLETVEARLIGAPNSGIAGEVDLVALTDGVRIHVQVTGASPGVKGIHVHQTADCSDIPNKSMGSHFSPNQAVHGLPSARHHHLGDLGNIVVERDGRGVLDITVPNANLRASDPLSFLGRSVVLHEAADNGSGEAGDSGQPVACAAIGL